METIYFKKSGEHTEEVLKVVKEFIEKEKAKSIVVASTTGRTGVLASSIFKGLNVVVVTHSTGFVKP
ncbi:MAG: pyruvate kinase alpha/beta domain-containing protein, partial [Nitrososphaerota archaeon]